MDAGSRVPSGMNITSNIKMVDLSTTTIKELFEQQIRELTARSASKDCFAAQSEKGWAL